MNKKFRVIAIALAIVTMLSIFTLSVFAAEEATTTTTTESAVTTVAPTDNAQKNENGLKTYQIVSLVVLGAVIVVAAVVVFGIPTVREKTFALARNLKSEWKKIAWYSWKNTRKGTLVVVVLVIAITAVILLLTTLFPEGINLINEVIVNAVKGAAK